MTTRYAMIGAAGYIAPRNMKAIKDTGGDLVVAFDTSDSVGIIDSHFPTAHFFKEFEHFDDHVDKLRRQGEPVDYFAICSPNYLHRSHIHAALRSGSDAICEKPMVLYASDLDDLAVMEKETGKKVNSILQLRLHPAIQLLKDKVEKGPKDKIYEVDLSYFTSRGLWYHQSWKGYVEKSGGIATNIGVHFYDMLGHVFGPLKENIVQYRSPEASAGYFEFEQARVRWVLSINREHLPAHTPAGQTTYRSITVDGDEVEFSGGFTDLHTQSYAAILQGKGYGIEDVRPSIEISEALRNAALQPKKGEAHPDLKKILAA